MVAKVNSQSKNRPHSGPTAKYAMPAMAPVAQARDVNEHLLFECAWEVANKGE